MSLPETVALIPARSGSKGVPNKNVRLLGGHPLMAYTIASCRRCALIDRVIVSTDSAEYAEIASSYGAEVPFLRPTELAESNSPDIEFVVHALDWLADEGREPTSVVHMRPTTPFRDPAVVDLGIDTFVANEDASALRSVHEMSESAYKTLEISPDGWLAPLGMVDTALDAANLGRQGFPFTYMAIGSGTATLAEGSGVTINSKDSNKEIDGQWAAATLIKTATDAWSLIGALA